MFSKYLQKYEYQEQTAEVEIIGADGSIFVSDVRKKILAWDVVHEIILSHEIPGYPKKKHNKTAIRKSRECGSSFQFKNNVF